MIKRNRVRPSIYEDGDDSVRITIFGMDGSVTGVVVIDKEDKERCIGLKWHVIKRNQSLVSAVVARINGRETRIHHYLFGPPPEGLEYDHINRNPLDNRKSNLRLCTCEQNQWNRAMRCTNTTGVKGVIRNTTKSEKWKAVIWHKRKPVYLGSYKTKEEAAIAYDNAVKSLKDNYSFLNIGGA